MSKNSVTSKVNFFFAETLDFDYLKGVSKKLNNFDPKFKSAAMCTVQN